MSTPTYVSLSKSFDALQTTGLDRILLKLHDIMSNVPTLLLEFAALETQAERYRKYWEGARAMNHELRAERDAALAKVAETAPRELADELLRQENDELRAELQQRRRYTSALYQVADRHAGVRKCKRCDLPYAQGYICLHCGWDSSDSDQLTDEQRKEWQASPEGQAVLNG